MRTFTLAALMVALVAVPAYCQGAPGGKKNRGQEQKPEAQTKKPDDKAYNAALSTIPNQKFDPWRVVRPSGPGSDTH